MADGHLARKSPSFGMIKPCYPVVLPSRQKPPSKWIHWTSRRISRLHERITAQLHAIVRSKSREWCLTSSRHGDRDRESERERDVCFSYQFAGDHSSSMIIWCFINPESKLEVRSSNERSFQFFAYQGGVPRSGKAREIGSQEKVPFWRKAWNSWDSWLKHTGIF